MKNSTIVFSPCCALMNSESAGWRKQY